MLTDTQKATASTKKIFLSDNLKGRKKTMCKNPNKKQKKAKDNANRVRTLFNTGTRTHKSEKDYNRKAGKKIVKNFEKGIDK